MDLYSVEKLSKPIHSRRLRSISFIPTTWEKLKNATEINDLWSESPLEDKLWIELKRLFIDAERQEKVQVKENIYRLDFAIYCKKGKIDAETDGDTWHADKERIPLDNRRNNDLATAGWRTLRFNSQQVQEEMTQYCIPTIRENIANLGGLKGDKKEYLAKLLERLRNN
ncbi:endonuclease domain-containing protein [Tumidithrix helvetica]|uniref:endonuclease domain-containing protein n=1 Tax=Tumidithrix helvetica TaxID=3457545 RepID=UPI003CC53931